MSKNFPDKQIIRILDANINRAKEGLRVTEEIARFILEDRQLTSKLKNLRHKIDGLIKKLSCGKKLIESRQASQDIGKNIFGKELNRKTTLDILFANIQRVKESIRVLEEFSKLINKNSALGFKNIRYSVYELEKFFVKKLAALHRLR